MYYLIYSGTYSQRVVIAAENAWVPVGVLILETDNMWEPSDVGLL